MVVRGTVTEASDGSIQMEVTDSRKGPEKVGSNIRVSSPAGCDPVTASVGEDVTALLVADGDGYAPINPEQGVSAFDEGDYANLR